jgi:hypothetical protein
MLTSLVRRQSSRIEDGVELSNGHINTRTLEAKSGLPYRLGEHRRNWTIWFSFFIFDGCLLPIILFYSLWYGSSLSRWTSEFAFRLFPNLDNELTP